MSNQNDPMMDESVAYQRGRNACRAGYKPKDNPYEKAGISRLAKIWLAGFVDQEQMEWSEKMASRYGIRQIDEIIVKTD